MPSRSMRAMATGLVRSRPASCSAATPLPASTTASTATSSELAAKNWPIGRRALVRSSTAARTASSTITLASPASSGPPFPRCPREQRPAIPLGPQCGVEQHGLEHLAVHCDEGQREQEPRRAFVQRRRQFLLQVDLPASGDTFLVHPHAHAKQHDGGEK